MQKIIVLTSHTNIIPKNTGFIESQYPELNKLLDDGYKVVSITPILKPADTSYMYVAIFVLEK